MSPTLRDLTTTYGLDRSTAYRVLAELADGASMSTALLNTMHRPSNTPTFYGGLFLPPSAYTRSGHLITCLCPTRTTR